MELFCIGLSAGVALSAVFAILRGCLWRRARNKKAAKDAALEAMHALYGRDADVTVRFSPRLLPGPAGKYRRTHTEFEFDEWALTKGAVIIA